VVYNCVRRQRRPNYTLSRSDFPLYQLVDPADNESAVLFKTNDAVSSAGVFSARFNGQRQAPVNMTIVRRKPIPFSTRVT